MASEKMAPGIRAYFQLHFSIVSSDALSLAEKSGMGNQGTAEKPAICPKLLIEQA
jgi:hypothetical protein